MARNVGDEHGHARFVQPEGIVKIAGHLGHGPVGRGEAHPFHLRQGAGQDGCLNPPRGGELVFHLDELLFAQDGAPRGGVGQPDDQSQEAVRFEIAPGNRQMQVIEEHQREEDDDGAAQQRGSRAAPAEQMTQDDHTGGDHEDVVDGFGGIPITGNRSCQDRQRCERDLRPSQIWMEDFQPRPNNSRQNRAAKIGIV